MKPLPPRPIHARADWHDLCGAWDFAYDDDDSGRTEGWATAQTPGPFDRTITVPFPPESATLVFTLSPGTAEKSMRPQHRGSALCYTSVP